MWIEDVKDSPLVKEIVEIAGKERIKDQARRTLAKLLATHAVKRKLDLPPDVEALLATHATEEALFEMANDMENMSNFREFVKSHGVELPR